MSLDGISLPVENLSLGSAAERRLKRIVRKLAAAFGFEVYRGPGLKLRRRKYVGLDIVRDVKVLLGRDLRCMIDGGAHFGETAVKFSDKFRQARIFSFEPAPSSFEALCRNTSSRPQIKPINAGLGKENGTLSLNVNNASQTNSLLDSAEESSRWVPPEATLTRTTIEVPIYALDDFVPNQTNTPVDLLKLDVQGYELTVLQGASRLLEIAAFPLIYLEICYVPQYNGQTSFPDVYSFLFNHGYRLVSTYPGELDIWTDKYRVGGDLLFIHESYGRA